MNMASILSTTSQLSCVQMILWSFCMGTVLLSVPIRRSARKGGRVFLAIGRWVHNGRELDLLLLPSGFMLLFGLLALAFARSFVFIVLCIFCLLSLTLLFQLSKLASVYNLILKHRLLLELLELMLIAASVFETGILACVLLLDLLGTTARIASSLHLSLLNDNDKNE